ncbi:protein kinase [Stieleria sp. JC731]|uniref:protein kinase domain-containing protein n=1 Tax=Pirellulaceae TaxID=2691357 RepID=UPI001E43F01B|nr:protein kinase [Stieleria sp. JC731]MCC9601072.1 protein kinase [Stieleria sp. JC731]
MTSPPPVEFQPGMEIVPGYTLIAPLGSGMAGDVWQAQAAGGIKVALKIVRSLKDVGGRKELKALKTIRDVHHPNLCPLFGFWTKDASGRILADGETEELTLDSVHSAPPNPFPGTTNQPPSPPGASQPSDAEIGGTMAIDPTMHGSFDPSFGLSPDSAISEPLESPDNQPPKRRITAEQLIVVMGLGDCTLYDRLRYVRQEAGLPPSDLETPLGIEPEETIRYLRAAASAIDLLNHEHDVYHFDIKPQNILLVGGEAQVCDFGLAKKIERDVRATQQTHATPAYASPEILEGEHLSTTSGENLYVDQYSLAVTYYELRTGLLPFDVTTHASMIAAKSTGNLDLTALTPPERKVLQKALQRDPKKRYRSCSDMITALAVASGVEKSGGITVTRILSTIATLLLVSTIGVTSWWYFFPESFYSFVNQGEINTARELLARTQASYDRTDQQAFAESSFTLINVVLSEAGDLASSAPVSLTENNEVDLRTSSQLLFANAADRLVNRVHQTLAEIEASGKSIRNSDKRSALHDCFQMLNVDAESPTEQQASVKQSINNGMQQWSDSENEELIESHRQFNQLLAAANLRWRLLEDSAIIRDDIQTVRTALEEQSPTFDQADSLSTPLCALLVAVADTIGQPIQSWTVNDWLADDLRADFARAEKLVGLDSGLEPYLSRWLKIRDQYISAVEPVATGVVTNSNIANSVLDEVRSDFPLLETDRLIARLRESIIDNDWSTTTALLQKLDTASNLDAPRKTLVSLVHTLNQIRAKQTAMPELRVALETSGITLANVRSLNIGPVIESFIRATNAELLANSFTPNQIDFKRQVESLLAIETQFGVQVSPAAFAVPLAAALILPSDDVVSRSGEIAPTLLTCIDRVSSSERYRCLAGALRIESMIRGGGKNQLAEASDAIGNGQSSILDLVSNAYHPFLQCCVAAINGEATDPGSSTLRNKSRVAIELLDNWRLKNGADMMALKAIELSDIRNDEIANLRYRPGTTQDAKLTRAFDYLRVGKLFNDHIQDEVSLQLECERLIQSVALSAGDPETVRIPNRLGQAYRLNLPSLPDSSQLDLAIHSVAMSYFQRASDTEAKRLIANQLVFKPTIKLLNRFGMEQFGPDKGESVTKSHLLKNVIKPTIETVLIPQMHLESNDIIPKPSSGPTTDADITKLFCKLTSTVYTDQTVVKLYEDDPDQRLRILIATTFLSLEDPQFDPDHRSEYLNRIAQAFFAMEKRDGESMLRFANRSAAMGATPVMESRWRADAYRLIGDATNDPAEKSDHFAMARSLYQQAVNRIATAENMTVRSKAQRFEALVDAAAIGVRLAYLSDDVAIKLPILKSSFEEITAALDSYEPNLSEFVTWTLAGTWTTKGNICEDIAFYCSAGDTEEEVERRKRFFDLTVEAFQKAMDTGQKDLKAQFSLGRALFRRASFYTGSEKQAILDQAADAFDVPPTDQQFDEDRFIAAEWLVWKMQIEQARGNSSDALRMAEQIMDLVASSELADHPGRVHLLWGTILVLGENARFSQSIEGLKRCGDAGTASEFLRTMGTLTDLVTRSEDPKLFTYVIETIVGRRPKLPQFSEESQEAVQLSKISTRAIFELSERLAMSQQSSISNTKVADLQDGARLLLNHLQPQSQGETRQLAQLLDDAQRILSNRNERQAIELAYRFARLVRDTDSLSPFLKSRANAIAMYSLMFWERSALESVKDLDTVEGMLQVKEKYQDEFDAERSETLIACLKTSAKLASSQDPKTAEAAQKAIEMIKAITE